MEERGIERRRERKGGRRGEGMGKGKEGGEKGERENSHRADLDRNMHGSIWAMETSDTCFDNQLFHSACQCP